MIILYHLDTFTHNTHTENIMASNPYELRQGLLGQAQQILVEAYHSEVQRCRDQGVAAHNVKFPSTEDIIAEAEKLYAFVQKK
jgi:hypothetical protein